MRPRASDWPLTDVRWAPRSSAAQTPSVYQSLVSPAAVVAWVSIRNRLSAGVSAFQDATRRVKPNPACTTGEVHVPLTSPGASTSRSPSSSAPLMDPAANALAEAKRVNWIGAGASADTAAAPGQIAIVSVTTKRSARTPSADIVL